VSLILHGWVTNFLLQIGHIFSTGILIHSSLHDVEQKWWLLLFAQHAKVSKAKKHNSQFKLILPTVLANGVFCDPSPRSPFFGGAICL
jgi:hypothetical protein